MTSLLQSGQVDGLVPPGAQRHAAGPDRPRHPGVQRQPEEQGGLLNKKHDDRPMLHQGSTGPYVVQLQSDLNQVGAQPPLAMDGIFGPLTRKQVVTFQTVRELLIDGIVGPQTWGALDRAKAGKTADDDDGERVLDRLDRLGDDLVDLGDHIIPGIGPFLGNPPNPLQPPPKGKKPPSSKTGDQLESWMFPHQKHNPIGQVHFATNNTALTDDDIRALDRLAEAVESYGDKFMSHPFEIEFHGFADPRTTTYPGGNLGLARDRAKACYDYFRKKLSQKASRSVKTRYQANGARPELAMALGIQLSKGGDIKTIERQMRTVAIVAPQALVQLAACPPATSRNEILSNCIRVLKTRRSQFSPDQARRLNHILWSGITRDSFLNGMDPKLITIAYGLGGPKWTKADAEMFAGGNRIWDILGKCYVSGPNADPRDTITGLKLLHDLIDQGMAHLAEGTGKDMLSGAANSRRVRLNEWVEASLKDRESVYYRWFGK